jgi:hypothetical protein
VRADLTVPGASAPIDGAESLLASGTRAVDVDGDLHAGREWFEAAYREGERRGEARLIAQAALGLGGWWLGEHRSATASGLLRARLRHALTLVRPDGPDAVRIRLRLAADADCRSGWHSATLAALQEARGLPDPAVRAEALRLAHHRLLGPDHGELRQALADELVGEAGRAGSRGHLLMGLLYQTVDLFLAGRPHAHRRLAELRAELGRGEHLAVGYVVAAIDVMLAIRAGRLAVAEQLAEDCLERGRRAGYEAADAWHGAQLVAIRWYQGRLPELVPHLNDLMNSPALCTVDNSFYAARAVAAGAAGDHPTAMHAMAALLQPTLTDLPRSGSWLATMCGFAQAAHLIGDEPAAAQVYRLLRPYANLPAMASLAFTCFGSVQHALGVAALTNGDLDRAVEHLRRAVHRNLALGHWPAVLYSRLRLADALDRRATAQDKEAAREERDQAAAVAARLQMDARASDARPQLAAPVPAGPVTCRRTGRGWRITLGARVAQVKHSVGMLHLAVLAANPRTEIPAIELVAGVSALARTASSTAGQPVLDRAAVEQYRRRLTELPEASDERTWLVAELTANTRPGGQIRAFADNPERARIAVGRAIRRALVHVEHVDPVIGAHLRATVHTGIRCWYRPL